MPANSNGIPKELRKYGLIRPSAPKQRRLVLTSEGGPGVGKTDLFYRSFPDPKLVINIDLNDEGVSERYEENDVLIHRVMAPKDHDMKRDRRIFDEIMEIYAISAENKLFRSIMIDEGAAFYTLCRRAYLDSLDFGEADQKDYTEINAAMASIYTLAKQERFNLYIPHRQTDERQRLRNPRTGKWGSQLTGGQVYKGWKFATYESQLHLLLRKNPIFERGKRISKFEAEILKCTARERIEGKVLLDEAISLPILGTLVFPQSEEEDWQ